MPQPRGKVKTLLLALLWGLSFTALCITLGNTPAVNTVAAGVTIGWTRTLPATGAWFLAAVALGLGYAFLARLYHAFAKPRLWLAAIVLAGVATLGESFAQTGTAELITSQKALALLYFVGRVPAYFMGMALLLEALSRQHVTEIMFDPYPAQPQQATVPVNNPARRAGVLQGNKGRFAHLNEQTSPQMEADRYPRQNAEAPLQTDTGRYARLGTEAASVSGGQRYPGGDPNRGTPRQADAQQRAPRQGAEGVAASSRPYPAGNGAVRVAQTQAASATPTDYRRNVTAIAKTAPSYPAGAGAQVTATQRHAIPTWGFMLLLLLCWLPYLYAIWPGTVSNDSITQLAEIFGRKPLSNGNPLFQTGLVWLFMSLGKSIFQSADAAIALYVCTQALLMAWLLGYSLKRMEETRAPRWLIGISTAFYALCPVFPIFAFCVGKDTNFAMAVLWLMMMAWRVVASKWPPMRTVVGLCLSAALCALLRNVGVALAGITLFVLLVWAFTKGTKQWRAPLMALAVLCTVALAMNLAVVPKAGAQPTPETENWSVPLQQVARVVASEPLTDEEHAAIDAVMPIDQVQPAYNGELSDPVKSLWREGVTPDQRAAFFGTWLRLGLKYPATYLSASFHNSYGYLLPGYVSTSKPTFLLGMEGHTTLIDGAFDFTVNPRADALKVTLQSLFQFAPFRLLTAPGAYGLIALFAFAAAMGLKKRANAICMLPALITLLGCLFSAVNGYYRYAMPLYFAAPVLLALLSQASHFGLRMRRRNG